MIMMGAPEMHVLDTKTGSRDETMALGQAVGNVAKQHLVIALVGDLGSGKTVFVKGLAKGLAVPDSYAITSPSYTLINEYPGRVPLFHADLYRLAGRIDIESTGLFETMDSDGVVAIEWAERLAPEDMCVDLHIAFNITGEQNRRITISACGQTGINLLKRLKKQIHLAHERAG